MIETASPSPLSYLEGAGLDGRSVSLCSTHCEFYEKRIHACVQSH